MDAGNFFNKLKYPPYQIQRGGNALLAFHDLGEMGYITALSGNSGIAAHDFTVLYEERSRTYQNGKELTIYDLVQFIRDLDYPKTT